MSDQRPVLLVDAMNLFVRSYAAYPQMSSNGHQMGGTIGFLKTLRRIIDESQPRAVYIGWEGGGSARRRAIYSDYKMNRKPEKMNRFYGDDLPDSDDNKKHQIIALLELIRSTPMCQLYGADCEGDDVVAYLARGAFRNEPKIIVSSDKDLLQLLDDKTTIYSLHKKVYVTADDVLTEHRITAQNFALAKALCGDAGDNIPGIKGLGFKKAAKLFPVLGTETPVILQDIFDYCASHVTESKVYKQVLDEADDVRRNWRLVQLDGNMLAPNQKQRIDNLVSTFKPTIDRLSFMRKLVHEGIPLGNGSGAFDVEYFFYTFNCIENLESR